MKKFPKPLILVVIAAFALTLLGCGMIQSDTRPADQAIVGTWLGHTRSGESVTYLFKADGTGVYDSEKVGKFDIKYKIDKEFLTITARDYYFDPTAKETVERAYKYNLTMGILTLNCQENGLTYAYKKQESAEEKAEREAAAKEAKEKAKKEK
ncbi:MAG: DUF5640 domain-containing protein [Bacillota bacterium]|jgi:hypothetical protein